ncbi:MAG: twin-arginine translocase TatA/TatE family subunit, partial [Rhodobacteraceae bacterium]|nr:twin-arginine translocase TatA/TatE family subunit [Paracoccaceae bacterium]
MFNNIGLPGLLLIAVIVLVLFGRGKIASMMG